MCDISVVVPVYGCKGALNELHERLSSSLDEITNDYEIVLVNDCCPQNSWEVIEEIAEKDSKVVGINLSRNFGQMYAILAGLDVCKGEWVVVMDCDLQDRPEEIPNLYRKAKEGFDVVFARRTDRKDTKRKVGISRLFFKLFSFATNTSYDPCIGNFSICNRKVIDSYCRMRELHRDYSSYIMWLGFKQTSIDTHCEERAEGKSSYTLRKKIAYGIDMLTSQSDKALRFFVGMGFVITFLSVVFIIIQIVRYFIIDIDPGWTSIVAVICLMGGIIITVLGVLGIYVGNTFMQSKNRPLYIVSEILNGEK